MIDRRSNVLGIDCQPDSVFSINVPGARNQHLHLDFVEICTISFAYVAKAVYYKK